MGLWMATKYPGYSVRHRTWNHTNQCYDAPENFQNGATGEAYVSLPGGAWNALSCPHAAAQNITTDLRLTAKIEPTNFALATKQAIISKFGDAGNRGYSFGIEAGKLYLWFSPDGTVNSVRASTANVPTGAAIWVRVVLDVNNGSSQFETKFYTSTDSIIWTQLGDTVVEAGTTTLYNSTDSIYVGARQSSDPFVGKIFEARIENGIGGPVVASPSLGQAWPSIVTTFTDGEANVWTKNGTCTVGNGSPEILLLCAGTPGYNLAYSNDATRFTKQTPLEPQLSFINYGHNEGANVNIVTDFQTLCTKLLTKYPNTGLVCTAQNPQYAAYEYRVQHAIRCTQIMELAATNHYAALDIYRLFMATGHYEDYLKPGEVHPNEAGQQLWLAEVKRFLYTL